VIELVKNPGLSQKDINFFANPHMQGRFLNLPPHVAAKIAALQLIRHPRAGIRSLDAGEGASLFNIN
jgi:hypothetical protein